MADLTWFCLGTGHGDTCDATGDTQRGAEKHGDETKHATSTCLADGPFARAGGVS